jgi:sialate O-acetylesterase
VIIRLEKSPGEVVLQENAAGSCCFELSDQAGRFYTAEAVVNENEIYVFSSSVHRPAELRYAWGDNPCVCVFNKAGLPMAPFRIAVTNE